MELENFQSFLFGINEAGFHSEQLLVVSEMVEVWAMPHYQKEQKG